MLPTVAILGRPNVGKSTLFNRLTGRKEAIISDIAGTTRDRKIASVNFSGRGFLIVDTAGILPPKSKGEIEEATLAQIDLAIDTADVIIFLIDAKENLAQEDEAMAKKLRRVNKKVIVAANKAEGNADIEQFYNLGFGRPLAISSIHGLGIQDLLEKVTFMLPANDLREESANSTISMAIVGRPNVGKSTLLNHLAKEERAIVTSIPGTTRDIVDAEINYKTDKIRLVDTAGIRKPGKVGVGLEYYSVLRAVRAIEEADVTVLVLDADAGLIAQDLHLAGLISDMRAGVVIAVNKWDTIKNQNAKILPAGRQGKMQNDEVQRERWIMDLQKRMPHLDYAPVVFISGEKEINLKPLLIQVIEVSKNRPQKVSAHFIDKIVEDARAHHPAMPPTLRLSQDKNMPYKFLIMGIKKSVHFSIRRYLVNELRETLLWPGWPIVVELV